jgi:GT2 family glycosyltransferase
MVQHRWTPVAAGTSLGCSTGSLGRLWRVLVENGSDNKVCSPTTVGVASESPPAPADRRSHDPETGSDAERSDLPFVSVVVPVYNDPEGIRATLDSLVEQSAPTDRHEIIVVDNGSTDDTRAVVREYCDSYPAVELLVEDEVQGSYAARNRGITAAVGAVVAFVDADMVVGPTWIEDVARRMAETEADYLACAVKLFTADDEGVVAKYNRLNDLHVQRFVEELSFAPTCCLVVRRTLLETVGGFDSRLQSGGDYEFGNRVAANGRRLHYCPDLVMFHPTRTSLGALLRKARRVGRGKTQLRRCYPDRYRSPLLGALNPGEFLPPRPSFMRRSLRSWSNLSTLEKVVFFVLSYLTSLAKAYGQLLELASPTEMDTDAGPSAVSPRE